MSLQELFHQADDYKNNRQDNHQSLIKQESSNRRLRAEAIYTSNALEGNTCTFSETETLLNSDCSTSTEHPEVIGHGAAYDYMVHLAVQDNLTITEDLIKHLHSLFYHNTDSAQAGKYRTTMPAASSSGHTPPAPADLAHFMGHFINQIESSHKLLHPIELAAMCHKRLMDIEPFEDGNGPIARLLMNLVLANHGYGIICIPPSLQKEYHEFLTISRTTHNTEPFVKLIAGCVIDSERKASQLPDHN